MADRCPHEAELDRCLEMVRRIARHGVGADTSPTEALRTIAHYVEGKQAARVEPPKPRTCDNHDFACNYPDCSCEEMP